MVIIQHKDGWSCSNEASIETQKIPVKDYNGKIVSFNIKQYCIFTKPFTVKGKLQGDVKIAIKDDVTGEVVPFSGVINGDTVVDLQPLNSKDFLVNL